MSNSSKNTPVESTSTTDPTTETVLDGEIVTDDKPTAVQRLRDFTSKHKAKLAFAGGVAGTFLLVSVFGKKYECEMDADEDDFEGDDEPTIVL